MVDFLTLPEIRHLLSWNTPQVMLALKVGTLQGKQVTLGGKTSWIIVHPGIDFVEYVRNPQERLQHIPLLSVRDVAAVVNCKPKVIRNAVDRGLLKPVYFKPHGETRAATSFQRKEGARSMLFTPFAVRMYIKHRQKQDPRKRRQIVLDDVVEWYKRTQKVRELDSVKAVKEEIRYARNCPEPQKSVILTTIGKMGQQVKEELNRRTPDSPAPA